MEPIDLQGIVAFVQAVEAGSFTGAGERLHVTKSAIGKSVAQLEQRLGVRLLNRTTRSLRPTSEGVSYYEACVRALAEIEAAQSLLAARRHVPSGRLRVDVPLAFGRRCVAPVLFEISRKFPELTVEISFNDRRVDLIEEGIDLAIRMGELDDSLSLAARRIYAQRSAICAAPAYLEEHGRPRSVEDLAHHSVIGYGREGVVSPRVIRHGDGRQTTFAPKARLVLGHGEPMLDAALAGCGIAFLPTWLAADSLRHGDLEMVLSDCEVENIAVHAVWPVTRALTPKVRVVVDALVEHFSAPPWDEA
ncbi:LysR family transcriptional regulator [Mesorhizobium erdmanii]|uniref:LysR family transcriptional regulator n=3 Tax=Mesorhizobium TaxID=68287 RepID=A0A3M9XG30_9HYPH|nr:MULTISPECIES: LysR family transcriptional regulator [Mesorhizobium]RNJ46815.1 LysR family transcriptional regulator [Mesorhizobium japonicum]RXT34179.1 LysR family transcriptional regulator [Mesorhizobium erdmanii]BAB49674.1 probable transcriptional regulator [Mesorhizobium japonicum MAFF 303099]